MTKQVSAAGEQSGAARPTDLPMPVGAGMSFGGPHLTAPQLAVMSEAMGGFQEQPAPPFAAMPETMPPPPMRPMLPPDLPTEPERPGLIARLLGGKAR